MLPPKALWRPAGNVAGFVESEREAIASRRKTYGVQAEEGSASGLALSGGGIRSATFSLGVLAALARRNLLPQFDYLSTVSGGGYAGCYFTSLLGRSDLPKDMGLRSAEQPFMRTEEESEYLMEVRQHASFLSAGFLERLLLVMRSTYGVFVNVLLLFGVLAFVAGLELLIRLGLNRFSIPSWPAWSLPLVAVGLLAVVARKRDWQLGQLNWVQFCLGALFSLPLTWMLLQAVHLGLGSVTRLFFGAPDLEALSTVLLALAILIAIGGAILAVYSRTRSAVAVAMTIMFVLLIEHSFTVVLGEMQLFEAFLLLLAVAVFLGGIWLWVDVNETSLHRYYRSKLATAFIYDAVKRAPPKLSEIDCSATFYPIINCALNAPGSEDPRMRGRLADVFSFTPHMTGSKVVDYTETKRWEDWNPAIDLASAMALSGAAISPQMGLRTTRRGSFWLTLFNARLHAWLRNPGRHLQDAVPPTDSSFIRNGPGLDYLVREFMGNATENLDFVNISDGGHIENLGVYELLKRRCRYIVAVDGESDPAMTFHALANLQRLAYIDMGVKLDADLDELRLQQTGFSRSHFRFCRIRYPTGVEAAPWEVGYLLYVKLSLTGNEGEFLRRYRLDEPMFPHHSTADQFFSETQFEAYRALGEHVGDKLFMEAIIEELAKELPVNLEAWMQRYAKNFPAKSPVNQI
ncbi:MAG: patatin-like phospholipase family protein [Alphaproteobacteria bacterium]|nr:patatin-like phospholipase family protein [Alphaproteobacteria bacterium]MBU1549656.1 patatin-like phospholipase family protein [Alphaproteobacteria bacterium]MBU2336511.1 patatin-like phospholipase family protein [Alphaproteobacteria bacterium]MBU2387608.1 patatin-like phospholipase family protein [Alphaproteobacteria bacterium]